MIHIQGSKEQGQAYKTRQSYGSYKRTEAWYERQSGQDRQLDTPVRESQSGDLMVFFLLLM